MNMFVLLTVGVDAKYELLILESTDDWYSMERQIRASNDGLLCRYGFLLQPSLFM